MLILGITIINISGKSGSLMNLGDWIIERTPVGPNDGSGWRIMHIPCGDIGWVRYISGFCHRCKEEPPEEMFFAARLAGITGYEEKDG